MCSNDDLLAICALEARCRTCPSILIRWPFSKLTFSYIKCVCTLAVVVSLLAMESLACICTLCLLWDSFVECSDGRWWPPLVTADYCSSRLQMARVCLFTVSHENRRKWRPAARSLPIQRDASVWMLREMVVGDVFYEVRKANFNLFPLLDGGERSLAFRRPIWTAEFLMLSARKGISHQAGQGGREMRRKPEWDARKRAKMHKNSCDDPYDAH